MDKTICFMLLFIGWVTHIYWVAQKGIGCVMFASSSFLQHTTARKMATPALRQLGQFNQHQKHFMYDIQMGQFLYQTAQFLRFWDYSWSQFHCWSNKTHYCFHCILKWGWQFYCPVCVVRFRPILYQIMFLTYFTNLSHLISIQKRLIHPSIHFFGN